MNLIIDSGNTLTKLAVFDDDKIVELKRVKQLTVEVLDEILTQYNTIDKAASASVARRDFSLADYFTSRGIFFIEIDSNTPMPIKNGYDTPQTLGIDRLVASVGGLTLFPKSELLVVDIGSAITIDRVNSGGLFLGGNISPGVDMRFKALNIFTAKLPLCEKSDFFSFCGKNSEEAIINGVMQGIANELDGYIDYYKRENNNIIIIFTGGDAKYFENKLKNTIFANCETLLIGINVILEYNYR